MPTDIQVSGEFDPENVMVWDCNMVDKSDYDKLLALYRSSLQPQMTNPAEMDSAESTFAEARRRVHIRLLPLLQEPGDFDKDALNTTGNGPSEFKANPNPPHGRRRVPESFPRFHFIITQAMEINHPFFRMTENK